MKNKLFIALYALAVTLLFGPVRANNESRLALLIGNAAYKSSPLTNPVNDVRLMEQVLRDSGFTVLKAENATMREMRRIVRDFGDKLKASGGVGLFYFAGHGVQLRGENYLVSTDSDIRNEDEVQDDALSANLVLEKMQSAGNRLNVVILDACRNNPFATKSRSSVNGLATMSAPTGSIVAYATAPGSVASDGSGKNGLYTEHLAKAMRQPGLAIEEVFKQVRSNVRRDSSNQQTPWENTALEGQFYFKAPEAPRIFAAIQPAAALPAAPAGPSAEELEARRLAIAQQREMAFWDNIKVSNKPSELQEYVNLFPSGLFVSLAKVRIQEAKTIEEALARRQVELAAQQGAANRPVVVAMAQPTGTAPSAAAHTASAAAHASPSAQMALRGQQVLTDQFTKKQQVVEVFVLSQTPELTTYSSGEQIKPDGTVLAFRAGTQRFKLKSGQLWRFPLTNSQSGKATVEVVGLEDRPPIDLTWKITGAANYGSEIAVQMYQYLLSGNGLRYTQSIRWSGTYQASQVIPAKQTYESSNLNVMPAFAAREIVNGEYRKVDESAAKL